MIVDDLKHKAEHSIHELKSKVQEQQTAAQQELPQQQLSQEQPEPSLVSKAKEKLDEFSDEAALKATVDTPPPLPKSAPAAVVVVPNQVEKKIETPEIVTDKPTSSASVAAKLENEHAKVESPKQSTQQLVKSSNDVETPPVQASLKSVAPSQKDKTAEPVIEAQAKSDPTVKPELKLSDES